jgi:hypothetical protein
MSTEIACTLDATDRSARTQEWRSFLASGVDRVDRASDRELRLRLADDSAEFIALTVDLARREQACCAFFTFVLELDAESLWLAVSVPPDAVGVLDGFAELAPSAPDRP